VVSNRVAEKKRKMGKEAKRTACSLGSVLSTASPPSSPALPTTKPLSSGRAALLFVLGSSTELEEESPVVVEDLVEDVIPMTFR
jgi:hypothetical protein